jgi:hypothetical protein
MPTIFGNPTKRELRREIEMLNSGVKILGTRPTHEAMEEVCKKLSLHQDAMRTMKRNINLMKSDVLLVPVQELASEPIELTMKVCPQEIVCSAVFTPDVPFETVREQVMAQSENIAIMMKMDVMSGFEEAIENFRMKEGL